MSRHGIAVALLIGCLGVSLLGADRSAHRFRSTETKNELLISGRFSDCDYGYYVLLPADVYAHFPNQSSANHGFLVALPDSGSQREASLNDARYLWMDAHYAGEELHTLKNAADYEIDLLSRSGKTKSLERHDVRLDGVHATRLRVANGEAVYEVIVALRGRIIYEIGMHSTAADYVADRRQLERLAAGFRFAPIRYC